MVDTNKLVLGLVKISGVVLGLSLLVAGCQQASPTPKSPAADSPAAKPVLEKVSDTPRVIRELSGEVALLPGHHSFKASVDESGKVMFSYEPPLPHTDGAMFGAMYDAITSVYGKDAGHYFGAKLTLYPVGAVNALAIEGDEYRYLGIPLKVSDEDPRFGVMMFWREAK